MDLIHAPQPDDDDSAPVTITVRMSRDLYAGLMRAAARWGCSKAAFLRQLLITYLMREGGEVQTREDPR